MAEDTVDRTGPGLGVSGEPSRHAPGPSGLEVEPIGRVPRSDETPLPRVFARAAPATFAARAAELARLQETLPVRRYRSLFGHWIARWFRPPRTAHYERPPAVTGGELALTFAGHASLVLRYRDLVVAFDPMLGRWVGGVRRAVQPGLAPIDLADVGLVLISHRHADHLHLPTLRHLPRTATIVVPAGGASWVSGLEFARVVELQPGTDLAMRGVQITAAPMSHGESELARGLSYIVRGDGPSAFLCGDSGYFSGFAHVGERFAPDLACLPIGGFAPPSFRARHMSPLDALYAFEDLRARVLVPIHHGAFALSYEELDEPARWLLELATARGLRDHVHLLAAGQSERFTTGA